jgi:hypothetical protein
VFLSRLASVLVLVTGILFGLLTNRITDVMLWLVGALYAGYLMANVLKWYWWRFNGYGYCWGMVTGMAGAMVLPKLAEWFLGHSVQPLYLFPVILGLSLAGCLLGTWLSRPEDLSVLKQFYRTVRPWGFWGPILQLVRQEDPGFEPNRDFWKDCTNVVVGIVWQLCLTALPIYLVLQSWRSVGAIAAVLAVTTIFLKFNWYDKLEKAPEPTALPLPSKSKAVAGERV